MRGNRLGSYLMCVVAGLIWGWTATALSEPNVQDTGSQTSAEGHSAVSLEESSDQDLSLPEQGDQARDVRTQPPTREERIFKRVDLGVTGWFSQGETGWSHNASGLDSRLGDPSSRLKYKDVGTNVLELNGKFLFNNRVFLRGSFGFSDIGGGRLTDDDFVSAQGATAFNTAVNGAHRFSRTYSDLGGSNRTDMWYLTADLGLVTHEFGNNKGFVDLFVGFQYWREKQVARGVKQVECTSSQLCDPPNTTGFNGEPAVTNRLQWYSARFGGDIEYRIAPRVSLDAKLVLLLSRMHNEDIHNLRTDLAQDPSFRMSGGGLGTNADVNLKVRLLQTLFLSAGYRVWFNSVLWDKDWKIYGANGTSATAPLNEFYTLRHGPTVSLNYAF